MSTDRDRCPECGEPITHTPPSAWQDFWGPRPDWSHLDGEPLCPVIGEHGYQPARPDRSDPR